MSQQRIGRVVALALVMTVPYGIALGKKAQKAHEHGAVTLDIAIDGTTVAITAEIPGDDAFGFEHPASNNAEKQAIKDALVTFRNKGTDLFQFPAEAQCTVKVANIKAAQEASAMSEKKPQGKDKKSEGEHADVDASYTFTCQKSPAGGALKLGLLKAFPRIKVVRVQLISGANQTGMTVHGASEEIKL